MLSSPHPLILICCHHKAGTSLFTTVFSSLSEYYEAPYASFLLKLREILSLDKPIFVFIPQAWHQSVERDANKMVLDQSTERPILGIHIIRDPRDMLVSGYYSHAYSHDPGAFGKVMPHGLEMISLIPFRQTLSKISKSKGLTVELDFMEWTFQQLNSWDYKDRRFLTVRFEDFVTSPSDMLDRIIFHLRLPMLDVETKNSIIQGTAFVNASGGRYRGEEDIHHHLRKGVPGDWRNHFSQELETVFFIRWGCCLKN